MLAGVPSPEIQSYRRVTQQHLVFSRRAKTVSSSDFAYFGRASAGNRVKVCNGTKLGVIDFARFQVVAKSRVALALPRDARSDSKEKARQGPLKAPSFPCRALDSRPSAGSNHGRRSVDAFHLRSPKHRPCRPSVKSFGDHNRKKSNKAAKRRPPKFGFCPSCD